ncbi:hypothetical protein HYV84_08385 [Candidatus Woesearchaeota archaeon]|nr:hypothetical protein [Candidatus Woesearchaeota archaeon]
MAVFWREVYLRVSEKGCAYAGVFEYNLCFAALQVVLKDFLRNSYRLYAPTGLYPYNTILHK